MTKLSVASLIPLLLGACTPAGDVAFDEDVEFKGNYSITVTNGANGCGFADWNEGQANVNIPLSVVEKGSNDLTATVEGIPGALLGLLHGSNVFTGRSRGNQLEMWIDGTIPGTQGNCSFTWSNDATATLDGDYLSGELVYSRAHNGNPDCTALTCTTIQVFNGTRPKSVP